jgi:hypothetical protein
VEEGPIFGYSSYQHIPDGTPFTLVYTFDDHKGQERILASYNGLITESEITNTAVDSPGTNAVLQIGDATWEFGISTRSNAKLNTFRTERRYELSYATPARDNHIGVIIQPMKNAFWPANADWRASFMATSLRGNAGEFSADNGRVAAKGHLLPSTLTISGIDLAGQWLSYSKIADDPESSHWRLGWRLAQPSREGGYIIEEITRTFIGIPSAGSATISTKERCWTALKIPAQFTEATDSLELCGGRINRTGSGTDTINVTARFYEGLVLPQKFSVGPSPNTDSPLSSAVDPHLETNHATLPVIFEGTLP